MFSKGSFDAVLVPLNRFEGGDTSWTDIFPSGWGNDIHTVSSRSTTVRKAEATLKTWARGGAVRPVPYPTNAAGQKLCHGAVLNFDVRPPHLHSAIALRRWLKARNATIATTKRHTYLGEWRCSVCTDIPLTSHTCTSHHTHVHALCRPKHGRSA